MVQVSTPVKLHDCLFTLLFTQLFAIALPAAHSLDGSTDIFPQYKTHARRSVQQALAVHMAYRWAGVKGVMQGMNMWTHLQQCGWTAQEACNASTQVATSS